MGMGIFGLCQLVPLSYWQGFSKGDIHILFLARGSVVYNTGSLIISGLKHPALFSLPKLMGERGQYQVSFLFF
jgi:hypothetical protein